MNSIYAGAGIAAAAGLLMGMAMKPDLGWDDRPIGPQIVAASGGARASGPFDDSGFNYARYNGRVPDYVLGTDWKAQPLLALDAATPPAEPEPRSAPAEDTANEAPQFTRADYDVGAAVHVTYPSLDGGSPDADDALPAPDRDGSEAG